MILRPLTINSSVSLLATAAVLLLSSCQKSKNLGAFIDDGDRATPVHLEPLPKAPDYSKVECWALLPKRSDASKNGTDVFYIHPTMFEGEGLGWVANLDDEMVNAAVDHWPIRHQASVFEGLGRVFAPRYRQAHYRSFVLLDSLSGAALDLAYSDVRRAFLYWLEHHDQGRPVLIAGHSQGTWHARLLLQEFFDGTPLGDRLVAAYIPGFDVYASDFQHIPPCESPDQTACFCSWRTYTTGYTPRWIQQLQADPEYTNPACINPITWTVREDIYSPAEAHLGTMSERFKLKYKHKMTARVHQGMLWLDEPDVFGARYLRRDNWHSGDYNLFWENIRQNAILRAKHFSQP